MEQIPYKKGQICIRTKTAAQYAEVKNKETIPLRLREGYVFQVTEDSPDNNNLVRGGADIFVKDNVRLLTDTEFNQFQGVVPGPIELPVVPNTTRKNPV